MELFCIVYYICSYTAYIPAIVKIIKTKSSNDYSLAVVAIDLIGNLCWVIYIFSTVQSWVVYAGTVIDFVLILIYEFAILRYFDFSKVHKQKRNVWTDES